MHHYIQRCKYPIALLYIKLWVQVLFRYNLYVGGASTIIDPRNEIKILFNTYQLDFVAFGKKHA